MCTYFVHPGVVHEVPSWSGCMQAANHFSTIDQKSVPLSWGMAISVLGCLHFLPQDMLDKALDGHEPSSVSAGESGWVLALWLTPLACSSSWSSSSATRSRVCGCSMAKQRYKLSKLNSSITG